MPQNSEHLRSYRQKRNFEQTPEPRGSDTEAGTGGALFVIQKHSARSLHYDFRLEADGVLKSWAVPKGPSTDPGEKRLASPTEDHPLDYADFEGTIPAGEYGGGTVLVWDTGTYRNITERSGEEVPIDRALENGHLVVYLEGSKLTGGYALTRIASGKNERWLLVKTGDDHADPQSNLTESQPNSVLTGRSLEQVNHDDG